jgi:AcrR family transcriptional regulator
MADIAKAAGVSTGNLYNYVESKEALFDLVLRDTLSGPGYRPPRDLPAAHRTPSQTVAWLRRRLDFASDFPLLEQAARDPDRDVRAVAGELFDVAIDLAPGFAVIERSAPDLPELLTLFLFLRRGLIERLTLWIAAGGRSGALRRADAPPVTARLILEAALWAAQRRLRDRESSEVSDAAARTAFVALTAATLEYPG